MAANWEQELSRSIASEVLHHSSAVSTSSAGGFLLFKAGEESSAVPLMATVELKLKLPATVQSEAVVLQLLQA